MAIDQEDINEAVAAGNRLMGRSSSSSSPMTIEALADKLEAVSSLGGYIMESKEAAQIVTALRSISSLSAELEYANRLLESVPVVEAPGDVAEIVPDRGTIASLIRERFDPCPDLGQASYKAFEDSWNDGAEEIADAILALMPAPSSAETASTDAAKTCNSYLERALAAEYELDKAVSEITRLSAATARAAEVDASLRREADMYQSLYEKLTKLRDAAEVRAERSQARLAEAVELIKDMAEAITAEVNEKGGGGSILARLSDARRFLVG
jgi:hypothetical protein